MVYRKATKIILTTQLLFHGNKLTTIPMVQNKDMLFFKGMIAVQTDKDTLKRIRNYQPCVQQFRSGRLIQMEVCRNIDKTAYHFLQF